MRILLFSYEFSSLGNEEGNVLYYLLREYADNSELQIDLVAPSIDKEEHLLKFGNNISIHEIPLGKKPANVNHQSLSTMLKYAWKAYKFSKGLMKENDEYVFTHAFSAFPCGMVSFFLKRKYNLPYMISLCESDVPKYNPAFFASYGFIKPIIKKIREDAYFIVAGSQEFAQLAMEVQPGKKVEVIHEGVDVHDFCPDAIKKNPDYFNIVCVSRIIPQKDIRVMIQAFKIISVRYDKIQLIIVGDGNERTSLEQLAQGLDLKDRIIFTGEILHKNAPEYYQKSDVFVLPSIEDKISNAVLEALACGLPIIAADTQITKEILIENENCFTMKIKDPDSLAEKLEMLILNRNLGKEMGRKNRELAVASFSREAIANKYIDYYKNIRRY